MSTFRSFALAAATAAFATLSLSGCASSLCERKHAFMSSQCAGGDASYAGDPLCESRTQRCSEAQKKLLEGYVSCLESQNMCSMEALASCAQKHPGGVNLAC